MIYIYIYTYMIPQIFHNTTYYAQLPRRFASPV